MLSPIKCPFRFVRRPLDVAVSGLFLLFFGFLLSPEAQAHKANDSYLSLEVQSDHIDGQWDLSLRDLEVAIGLDSNGDGEITLGELKEHRKEVESYAFARFQITADGRKLTAQPVDLVADEFNDGVYAVLQFKVGGISAALHELNLDYRIFFDHDAQHQGLFMLKWNGQTRSGVFTDTNANQTFTDDRKLPVAEFLSFVKQGIWHIWLGFDHILFLLALLLPAVLYRRENSWIAVHGLKVAFWNVCKVVTAFTLAHSITLSLATLGLIRLPSRIVESAIAASVILAALNNLSPKLKEGRAWMVAFGFGLIHGFGFASVLSELGLQKGSMLPALLGFNFGVELGQLAIVLCFVPVAYLSRHTWFYRHVALKFGSAAVASLAMVWMVERVFGLTLLGF